MLAISAGPEAAADETVAMEDVGKNKGTREWLESIAVVLLACGGTEWFSVWV